MRRVILALALVAPATEAAAQDPIGSTLIASVRLEAGFAHGTQGQAAFESGVIGRADLALRQATGTATLEFRIGLGESACRLTALWWLRQGKGAIPTGPLELCLAAPGATPADLHAWIAGHEQAPSPELKVPLTPDQTGAWVNAEPVAAQAFVRSCDGKAPGFRRYADLSIGAGALRVAVAGKAGAATLTLAAKQAMLTAVDDATWQHVRERCGNANVPLPIDALPGTSRSLLGLPLVPGQAPPSLHERVDALRLAVDALAFEGALDRHDAASLVTRLDGAVSNVDGAEGGAAAEDVDAFVRRVERLAGRGRVESKVAQSLTAPALAVAADISTRLTEVPSALPAPPLCFRSDDCVFVTLHVSARRGRAKPDGSAAAPFRSIGDALAEAERRSACGVEVVVHGPGTFAESIVVTRHTRLRGADGLVTLAGSIVNFTASRLDVTALRLERAPSPGAVVVDHPCADTRLVAVSIVDAERHGIWQRGGTLAAGLVSVVGTRAASASVSDGAGILLEAGVVADVALLDVRENASAGIVADGAGTRLAVDMTTITDNGANPMIDFCAGPAEVDADRVGAGLVARSAAAVSMSMTHVRNNTLLGVLVIDGARGDFESVAILATREIRCGESALGRLIQGGINAASIADAALVLDGFVVADAPTCGLILARGATIDAAHGTVHDNSIGACVRVEGYRLARLVHDVVYRDNDVNLEADSDSPPIPPADPGI